MADSGKITEKPSRRINNPAEVKNTGGLIVDDSLLIIFSKRSKRFYTPILINYDGVPYRV